MDAICTRGDSGCEVNALTAALHCLHLYCIAIAVGFVYCCAKTNNRESKILLWRWQNLRGICSLAIGVIWCCNGAAAAMRADRVAMVAGCLAPPAWLAATLLHGLLWSRRSSSPILYIFLYWLLSAATSAATLYYRVQKGISSFQLDLYVHSASVVLCVIVATIDGICFYDETTDKKTNKKKLAHFVNSAYEHMNAYFYSKITFFWINKLLYKGLNAPLEQEDLGELPNEENSEKHYAKFKEIYNELVLQKTKYTKAGMWRCYMKMVWPNFYIGGVLKLLGDILGLVPPLGLAIIVQFIVTPTANNINSDVTIFQFIYNGYIMVLLIVISCIGQAILSQNSTHLVSVEGIRLKTALQGIIFDKCMNIAPWAAALSSAGENEPLLNPHNESSDQFYTGLLTNLVSQDTYNIMSCVWVCHYLWAIPLKVSIILYLLYEKLGISAIIGCATSIFFVTPLQFYIGKKISDNSKEISKTGDHRISKMTEILQGMSVIKLYVWEDLFKEKILCLREVELKLLVKDSIYWGLLTFSTQLSTILVTVVTFTVYYFIEGNKGLTAVNVFSGLALFSQLSVPLLILPVTVLMVIQATISTKRIKDFLLLPESSNIGVEDDLPNNQIDKFNDAFVDFKRVDSVRFSAFNKSNSKKMSKSSNDTLSGDQSNRKIFVEMKNVLLTWGMKTDTVPLEIDDLELEKGKLIIVIGSTGSGKSSLLSAVLGEMFLDRGNIIRSCTTWYAGQPPWLLETSVRDNILLGSAWCQRRYARVLRSAGLKPDLQLLPEGDETKLGSRGVPLSGGQRVRVCIARALYSDAQLLVLDEPLGALDASLARHVVARGLVPAARSGRTVLLATNRLELLHYADKIIVMEDCRVVSCGRVTDDDGVLKRWGQLAAEARACAARAGVGPAGGTARERTRLVRAVSRAKLHHVSHDETTVGGVREATGAHLLTEVPMCAGGSWRRMRRPPSSTLTRQFSSPPPSVHQLRRRREVRRAVSADASNDVLQREASLLRRLFHQRPHRTLSRWTPRPIRRLLSLKSNVTKDENCNDNSASSALNACVTTDKSEETTMNEMDEIKSDKYNEYPQNVNENIWWEYAQVCGWWGLLYWIAAAGAQGLAVAGDWWLAKWTDEQISDHEQTWIQVRMYAVLCACGAIMAGCAQAACACASATARRTLHDRLLNATLYAPLHHHDHTPLGSTIHRFSADILIIDKKLPTTVCRWAQLALVCGSATLVNALVSPWSLLAVIPAFILYFALQTVYRRNARELQRLEAASASPLVTLVSEARAGAATVRASRLQSQMRTEYLRRLNDNHNALLLLNATNRWLGFTMDLVGAGSVCASLGAALAGARGAAPAGLAGAYSLLLPAYLAHLAKCRADLDLHLAAVERVHHYSRAPREDYRDQCPPPDGWPINGDIQFDKVSVRHDRTSPSILTGITINIATGERVALCGRSGCGKSSLLLSCAGAAQICAGRLRVGGESVDGVPLRALRHRLVVLPQEIALFSGTLRENLDPLAVHTDLEIWQCLRVVGLHEFVAAQPAGLECWVGGCRSGWSGRSGWSAGRAGRLGAARAVLRAPRAAALLLDEPGAALDAAAERTLLAAIAASAPDTTILTIAHRVSSVRTYDRVVVVDRGRVAETGAPAALLAEPASRFARMCAAATRSTLNKT